MKKSLFTLVITFFLLGNVAAQETKDNEESKWQLSASADVVNSYVWRGLLYNDNLNIQPQLGVSKGAFFAGAWGSYATSGNYAEVDFYAGFAFSHVTLTVSDYFGAAGLGRLDHFNWDKDSTSHMLEGTIAYRISDDFPLTLTAATFFYGNDRDAEGDNYYSTYIEARYPWQFKSYTGSFFIGGTPAEGLYAQEAGIVNLGCSVGKQLDFGNLQIPVAFELISNPKAEDIFFVCKVTL
ncbi:MAG: hypothetical protein R6U66_14200 [Bacteroidales bacterium]|jgi:hypothetical protein